MFQQNTFARECPCDIYEEAGTPCAGAYSMIRQLNSKYNGPLYQVRRSSDGQTKDIPQMDDGFADSKVQDDFLGGGGGTVSKLYDQSGNGNDLTVAKKGCYNCDQGDSACKDDKEANAKGRKLTVAGHTVYGLYIQPGEGYRTNQEGYAGHPDRVSAAKNMPTGNQAQGIYGVVDGKRPGQACCFNFGNGSTNNCYGPTGQMNTLYFGGVDWWGTGAGRGPWFQNDMEAGVWAGGSANPPPKGWSTNPSITWDYAFGISKTSTENNRGKYCLRVADATNGDLTNAYDGDAPSTWKMEGGILLGIGGDNSNHSFGTFFEGCITKGRPSNDIDAKVLKNVQSMHYGSEAPVGTFLDARTASTPASFSVRYIPSTASAIIRYSLESARTINMRVFNQKGMQIETITSGVKQAGGHVSIWNTKHAAPGVYVVKTAIDGTTGWTDKIVVGR
ncbi:MAG: hypothetical protein JW863_16990 [Chitinispirillaceae bacterium]|nr:hypothetical protein [Chitinispirillaceae bacterium]